MNDDEGDLVALLTVTSCCVYVCDPTAVFRLRSDGQQKKNN
jgi:hypothetical protein